MIKSAETWNRLAGSIQAIAFGYAFDDDGGAPDGLVDTDAGGNIIWAYDSNADGFLDTILDSNNDGVIDASDTPTLMASTVPINRIRASAHLDFGANPSSFARSSKDGDLCSGRQDYKLGG